MNTAEAQDILQMYVNDMLALEQDTAKALASQSEDEDVKKLPVSAVLVLDLAAAAQARVAALDSLAKDLGGGVGKAVKDALGSVAGVLAGLYAKVRKHPVSRMLRDDYTALSLAVEGYSMLHTTALALRDPRVAALAERHMTEITPHVMRLAQAIPAVVISELAEDFPGLERSAADQGAAANQAAWRQ
ncbi:MAG: hypothetical protein V4662_19865 [Verrucomicrobiota bacterium]